MPNTNTTMTFGRAAPFNKKVSITDCQLIPAAAPDFFLPSIELAVIVPTFNERQNVAPLFARLATALNSIMWEIVFVDDNSPDGTGEEIRRISETNPNVRLIERSSRRGLSSACIEGILVTAAPYIAIMDGDLQHDECALSRMFGLISSQSEQLDIVVASRNICGGSMGRCPYPRVLLSRLGARISRFVCQCDLSDPMSGFFMFKRSFFEQVFSRLSLKGFKLLVDLIASSEHPVRVREIPYQFRRRQWGKSKLNVIIGLQFLLLVVEKMFFRRVSTAVLHCPKVVSH